MSNVNLINILNASNDFSASNIGNILLWDGDAVEIYFDGSEWELAYGEDRYEIEHLSADEAFGLIFN